MVSRGLGLERVCTHGYMTRLFQSCGSGRASGPLPYSDMVPLAAAAKKAGNAYGQHCCLHMTRHVGHGERIRMHHAPKHCSFEQHALRLMQKSVQSMPLLCIWDVQVQASCGKTMRMCKWKLVNVLQGLDDLSKISRSCKEAALLEYPRHFYVPHLSVKSLVNRPGNWPSLGTIAHILQVTFQAMSLELSFAYMTVFSLRITECFKA